MHAIYSVYRNFRLHFCKTYRRVDWLQSWNIDISVENLIIFSLKTVPSDTHIFQEHMATRRYSFSKEVWIWRFFFRYEPLLHEISSKVVCAASKGSDQPAHTRSLIRAFASRLNILWVLSYWPNNIESSILTGGCTGSSEFIHVKMAHNHMTPCFRTGTSLTAHFWGRMLASGLNFNTYSFSVTSIFHPCQAIH